MSKRGFTAVFLATVLLIGLFLGITVSSQGIHNYKIQRDIFAYVKENKDTFELTNVTHSQQFPYSEWGFGDAGVMYGYLYDPAPNYETVGQKYHGGYRIDGATTYGDGWFYYQKICENWYYYEEHYG